VFLTQGETTDPGPCAYVGRYLVTGFPADGRRPAVVDIAYAYDENAIVAVSATERTTGTVLEVRVEEVPADVPERFLKPPTRAVSREPMTVYLAFDLSGSMSGDPLAQAQKAARAFVDQLDLTTTAVGLVGFSDRVRIAQRATHHATEISAAIGSLQIGETGYGNIAHPFDHLAELLSDTVGRRFALVLADGVWSCQPQAVQRAKHCHQRGIDVIAVGFGGADHEFLAQIASSTQQAFFTQLGGLVDAFSTIARELTEGSLRPVRAPS
jgi:uncharacterized protein YegL